MGTIVKVRVIMSAVTNFHHTKFSFNRGAEKINAIVFDLVSLVDKSDRSRTSTANVAGKITLAGMTMAVMADPITASKAIGYSRNVKVYSVNSELPGRFEFGNKRTVSFFKTEFRRNKRFWPARCADTFNFAGSNR